MHINEHGTHEIGSYPHNTDKKTEVQESAFGHTAHEWRKQDLNSAISDSRCLLLPDAATLDPTCV